MDNEHQIVEEFLSETNETLDRLDRDIVALEESPSDQSVLNRVFRAVHTIKGTCGFLGFSKLESITHVGEHLLDGVRSGKLSFSSEIGTALLKLLDATRAILQSIAQTKSEGPTDYSDLVALLSSLNVEAGSRVSAAPSSPERAATLPIPHQPSEEQTPSSLSDVAAVPDTPITKDDDLDALFRQAQADYQNAEGQTSAIPEGSAAAPSHQSSAASTTTLQAHDKQMPTTATESTTSIPALSPPPQARTEEEAKSTIADTALRVDVALLDHLMDLVGELVLARNQILQFTKSYNDASLVSTSQRLNLITSELQEQVMRTRMQPIANVWGKFPRVVRDVARACGKRVRIEMQGKETDLDKTIIEAIKDPLTHLVRNAVDHGIETPEVRTQAGKDPEGILLLRAYHEGGTVIIEIADDGAGLNTARIKAKAIERGVISAEKASAMSEQEIHNLIFLPGFSTAEKVTNISGRGVGMDVVRSNIEKIGGSFDLKSAFGHGTTLRIKIPLTLAIIPALLVSTSGERFAIPQVNLVELVRVEATNFSGSIEKVNGASFYRLRGNLLPLVFLSKELRLEQCDLSSRALNIVVMKADEKTFGLVVDVVRDTEEIVVKPLSKQLKHLNVFAGATIMGDGHVALILDVVGLARRARVVGDVTSRGIKETSAAAVDGPEEKRTSLLIVQIGENMRAAVPLASVQRLEEIAVDSLERGGGIDVVQYRGGILPLIDLAALFSSTTSQRGNELQVIVFASGNCQFGCVVDGIVDIVEEVITVQKIGGRVGVRGSAIIGQEVTDLLDIDYVVQACGMSLNVSEGARV